MGNLAILEKMTFLTQKILFFKIESCLSLVDRFRIELSDTIFEIRKKRIWPTTITISTITLFLLLRPGFVKKYGRGW